MKNLEFSLEGQEFIELIKLLKFVSIAQSGGEAKQLVDSGEIKLNDEVELRKRKKIIVGDKIEVLGEYFITILA